MESMLSDSLCPKDVSRRPVDDFVFLYFLKIYINEANHAHGKRSATGTGPHAVTGGEAPAMSSSPSTVNVR